MRNGTGLRLSLLVGSGLLGALISPAFAQTGPATPAADDPIVQSGPATADDIKPGADDDSDIVIVTATKRETDLQDTAISMSVIDDAVIEDRHVQALLDLGDGAIPSLRVTTFEARQSALTIGIRGIVPNDANQPAREQGVGVYLDGVYLGRQHGLNASLLDLERIEVLKGPQGTLFGRNTEGGALSLVTKRPSGMYGFRATAGFGNLGAYSADGHLDLPEVAGVSIKIDAVTQYRDALVRNPLPGQTGWGFYDRQGLRAAALWEPIDTFSAQYSFDAGHDENSPFYSQLINYNPAGLVVGTGAGQIKPLPPIVQVRTDRMTEADIGVPQQPSIDDTFGHALNMTWDMTPDIQLRSVTAYREVDVEQWDNSGGAHRPPVFTPNGAFSRYSLANFAAFQRSQEFQAVGTMDRLDYVIGVYYFNEKVWDDAATPSTNQWNTNGTAYTIRDPSTFPGSTPGARSFDRASVAWSESSGIYAHIVYTPPILDDAFHLTLGGRQTHDAKSGILFKVNNAPRNFTFSTSENRFDPVVTAAYDVSPDINIYATWATGYRAGGASSRSLTYRSFGPEEVESVELGLKSYLFDTVRFNLAVYNMERTDSQIDFTLVAPDPVTGASRNTVETVNAPGTTEIRGVELDASWDITDELKMNFAYAYTDTNLPPATNPFTGVVQPVWIIYTPTNVVSGGLDYSLPLDFGDFRAHIDANYASGTQSFEQFGQETDDSFIVNGRLSLANLDMGANKAALTLSLWARNLLDEEHIYRRSPENRTGANALGDYANFNEPRAYGVEATVSF